MRNWDNIYYVARAGRAQNGMRLARGCVVGKVGGGGREARWSRRSGRAVRVCW